ncbi:hypothetical protein ACFVIY_04850 [Streptomyces sp. NPDC127166]|uniref:hypothetical protein n=1 Tax=Streptomyces sp. NPDC127166 TaxID=3345380 RepID=UPI003637333D
MSQAGSPPGARPTRRAGRWERYRVTHPSSARDQAGLWGAIVGTVGLAVLLGWALDMRGGVVLVAAVPFIVSWYENRRTAFRFDAAGVRFGTVPLPWSDVTQLVVATPDGGAHALIGARLRPGVPVPAGADLPAPDPAMPAPVHVAVLRATFDLRRMVEKSRRYAPSHLRIVVADPSGERVAS